MVLGVVKPSIVDPADIKGVVGAKFVQSHCGHFMWLLSLLLTWCRISGPKFI